MWHDEVSRIPLRRHSPYRRLQLEHALGRLHRLAVILGEHADLEERGDVPVVGEGAEAALLPNQVVEGQTWMGGEVSPVNSYYAVRCMIHHVMFILVQLPCIAVCLLRC